MIYLLIYLSIGFLLVGAAVIYGLTKNAGPTWRIEEINCQDILMYGLTALIYPLFIGVAIFDLIKDIEIDLDKIVVWRRKVPPSSDPESLPGE